MPLYNTMNPIGPYGSVDPRDLNDNSANLDVRVNSLTEEQWDDRLGVSRWTWYGFEQRFARFLANSGYVVVGDYEPTEGLVLDDYNQVIRDVSGTSPTYWRLNPDTPVPYVTTGEGMDEDGAFVFAGDDVGLRAELSNPATGGDLISVTTATGEQTLVEALGSRVLYEDTKADLDAIPTAALADGQEAMVLGTPFRWDATAGEWVAQGPINVAMYGTVADGTPVDGPAVKAAIEALRDGETLHFPPGHYKATYLSPSNLANWALITANGVTLDAAPGTVILENFLIGIQGTFDAPMNIGSRGFTVGDTNITTAGAHGLAPGDVVQVLSQINCYSTDAGDYQLGSREPNDNVLHNRRFAEIHRVQSVVTTTEFMVNSSILYPNYANNTTDLNDPMPGVTSAQIRKINPVFDTTLRGITFQNVENNQFREIYAVGSYGLTFDHCGFVAAGQSGAHVRTESAYGTKWLDCWDRRSPEGASGSGWNSFFLSAGSHGSFFIRCEITGGQQSIDWSPLADTTSPFYDDIIGDGMSVQLVGAHKCIFRDCVTAATTHPGTYLCSWTENELYDCQTGFLQRSLATIISGNTLQVHQNGILCNGFVSRTSITGNRIMQQNAARFPTPVTTFLGVGVHPTAVDVMSQNNTQGWIMMGNLIIGRGSATDMGLRLRHNEPTDPEFTEFTDAIKTTLSDFTVMHNTFLGCNVRAYQYCNGVTCMYNRFDRCGNMNSYFESLADSMRHRVGANTFDGAAPTYGVITRDATLSYDYNTAHRVGGNMIVFGTANNNLANTNPFQLD